MKAFYTLISLFFVLSTANATSVVPNMKYSKVTPYDIQHKELKKDQLQGGFVEVDFGRKVIDLQLMHQGICPEGAACNRFSPVPMNISFSFWGTTTLSCGSLVHSGYIDMILESNSLEVIHVVDNTTNTCDTDVALPKTEVYYETNNVKDPNGEPVISVFHGTRLKFLNE